MQHTGGVVGSASSGQAANPVHLTPSCPGGFAPGRHVSSAKRLSVVEWIDQHNAARKLSPGRDRGGEEGYEADRCDLICCNLCFYLMRAYRT